MLTGAPQLIESARMISLHGMSRDAWRRYDKGGSWYYEILTPGYKYNMTDLQAAIGIRQLQKLAVFQQRRRAIVADYHAAFAGNKALEVPVERPEVEHAWHLYVLRLHPKHLSITREQFIEALTARGIGTSVHFIPVHLHPYYRDKYGYRADDFPVALKNYQRMISLPLNAHISDEQVRRVIEAVTEIALTHRRRIPIAA